MKTDDLIAMLASNAEPVSYEAKRHKMLATLALGTVVAIVMMYFFLGLRPDLERAVVLPMFWLKLEFPGAVAFVATVALLRLGSPGMQLGRLTMALVLPFALVWAMALLTLADASPEIRPSLILGSSWERCSISIAFLAVPIWLAVFWAARQFAPTRLRTASAVAGLFAGAAAATVYAAHCTEMQAPFLAVWYVLGMLIPAALGWAVGPKLLRW